MSESPLNQEITDASKGPRKASVDGQSAESHPIKDLIEADQYLERQKAARSKRRGLKINKFRPPGSI